MIELKKGNLLEADADALVNTVNCVGVMGKGIALQFKQAFPENFRSYQKACKRQEVAPGTMLVVSVSTTIGPKFIINFPTKRHWKQPSYLEDIEKGLPDLSEKIKEFGITSIAVPPLGCGNGGLNWSEVEPLIRQHLENLPNVRILLYAPEGAPAVDAVKISTARPKMTMGRALLIRLLEPYQSAGRKTTLLEIQKLAYLLQQAGGPLKLEYQKEQYGPYAEKLNHALQSMQGHYISGYGDRSQKMQIVLLPGALETANSFLEEYPDVEVHLHKVRMLVEQYDDGRGLELLTTVHWVTTENMLAAADVSQAIQDVRLWNTHKRVVFPPSLIEKAWSHLNEQGWIGQEGEM